MELEEARTILRGWAERWPRPDREHSELWVRIMRGVPVIVAERATELLEHLDRWPTTAEFEDACRTARAEMPAADDALGWIAYTRDHAGLGRKDGGSECR